VGEKKGKRVLKETSALDSLNEGKDPKAKDRKRRADETTLTSKSLAIA